MKFFWFLSFFILFAGQTYAEEMQQPESAELEAVTSPAAPETVAPVVYTVEKEIKPVPACDDKTLMAKTKEYITAFFDKSENKGVLFRRRRHFLINNMTGFTTENIANYKTAATSPVSDEIVDLQINHNVLEENMRLCKKQAANKLYGDIYLLVYPSEKGYKVHVLNLDKQPLSAKNIFEYQPELDFSSKAP